MSGQVHHLLADLLQQATEARNNSVELMPRPGSPANIDCQGAILLTGDAKVAERVVLCVDVFTAVAADQLGVLETHVRAADTIFGLFPLMRAVVEHSVGAIWVTDPDVDPEQRWARAGLFEWRMMSDDLDVVTHWAGAKDADRQNLKLTRRALQKELERTFALSKDIDPAAIPVTRKLDAPPYALAGETFPSIESNISHYLDDPGDTVWRGAYTYLCHRGTHPSLGSAQFIDRSPGGTGFTLSDARLVWLVRATLGAYGRALEHLIQWCGWDTTLVDALIDDVQLLDPTAYFPN